MFHHQVVTTRARFAVADYIEVFYNRQRHSTLGYRTPADSLNKLRTAATAA